MKLDRFHLAFWICTYINLPQDSLAYADLWFSGWIRVFLKTTTIFIGSSFEMIDMQFSCWFVLIQEISDCLWLQFRSFKIRWSSVCLINFEWIWCRHFQCQPDFQTLGPGSFSVRGGWPLPMSTDNSWEVCVDCCIEWCYSKPTGFLACGTQVNLPYLEVGLRHRWVWFCRV